MTFIATLTAIVGTIMGLSSLPQAIKIFKRKSAKDIAALTFVVIDLGALVWIFYGIEINSFPIIISNCITMITATIVLIGCYLY